MSNTDRNNAESFSQYLLSTKLEELETLANSLYEELQDSKKVMAEMCTLMDSIPKDINDLPQPSSGLRPEDISQFVMAPPPRLLLPNMPQNPVDVDLDNLIITLKEYAENIKKNFVQTGSQQERVKRSLENLDWNQYEVSFDKFSKYLANIKQIKSNGGNRNLQVEAKMDELCKDVNMFTQVFKARTTLSENNRNWTTEQDNKVLYEVLINKILLCTSELSYLLKNKK